MTYEQTDGITGAVSNVEKLNDFRKALEFTLKWEGGYTFDPDDPGGETKWGISKRAHPDEDISLLTPERAAQIYADEYWEPLACDCLEFPVNVAVFDTAVNCGVDRAGRWARESDDIKTFLDRRMQHYIDLVNRNDRFRKFMRGWTNRLNDLRKFVEINSPEVLENPQSSGEH